MQVTHRLLPGILTLLWLFQHGPEVGRGEVRRMPTPNGGIQPQVKTAPDGTVHLLYFKGDPREGDLYHVQRQAAGEAFSRPLRVNSRRNSAMAIGTIRGGQLALGKGGRVHVVWNSMKGEGFDQAPLFYTRMKDDRSGFEGERNMITRAHGLDGGSSVAAGPAGNVYVVWHAPGTPGEEAEADRAVFVARSIDDGRSFEPERKVSPPGSGVCGCCGLQALASVRGEVFILFRSASEQVNRDQTLLVSRDQGLNFDLAGVHKWDVAVCPMSSAFLGDLGDATWAAWQTGEQIYFAGLDRRAAKLETSEHPPGEGKRKHPVLARNRRGETVVAWTEGTGWQRGGDVAWQVYDSEGRPTSERGREKGVPPWGLVGVFAEPDGGFVIVH